MGRLLKRAHLLVAAAVCLACAGEARAEFRYDLTLGAAGWVNDNLHLDPKAGSGVEGRRAPVKETVLAGVPGVVLDWQLGRDRLGGEYRGEYWRFSGDEDLDPFWVHTASADLSWRRWSPFFLELSEERGRVPRVSESENEAYVDQIDRNRVAGRTGLSWEFSPTGTFELAYAASAESYPGTAGADRVFEQSGEGSVRTRWSPLWQSALGLSYGATRRDLAADYTSLRAFGSVDQRWDEQVTLHYQLEWRRENDDGAAERTAAAEPGGIAVVGGDGARDSLLVGADLRWSLARGGYWTLGYADEQANSADGDTVKTGRASAGLFLQARLGSSLQASVRRETRDYRVSGREETVWGPTLGLRWVVLPRAACEVAGSWTSSRIREADLPEVEDKAAGVTAALVVMLYDHVQLEAGYAYRVNESTDPAREYRNGLLFAGLAWRLQPVAPGGFLPLQAARLITSAGAAAGAAVIESARPPWQSTPSR